MSAGYDGEGGDGGGDGGWLEDGLAACRAAAAREDGLAAGGLGRGCVLYMVQRWKARYDWEGGDGGGDDGWLEDGLAAGGLGHGCALYVVHWD